MNRAVFALVALSLVACGNDEEEEQQPDVVLDGGLQPDAGSTDEFSFYLNGCRAHPGDVVGTKIEVAGGQDVLVVTDEPVDPAPWCQRLSDASYELTDAREGVTGTATFDMKFEGNKVTVSGTARGSGTGPVVTASSGFTLLQVRGGGGGVERVRVTINCSGGATGAAGAASVELANGETVCSTGSANGILLPFEKTTAVFEDTTTEPSSVLVALRIRVEALGGDEDGYSSSAHGSFEIIVEPL